MPYKNREFRREYDRLRNLARQAELRDWYPKSHQGRRRYLSATVHHAIKATVGAGESMAEVARMRGISYSTVKDILYGKSHPRGSQDSPEILDI